MRKMASVLIAVALLIGAAAFEGCATGVLPVSGGFALVDVAMAEDSTQPPAVAVDAFDWYGTWQYSAEETWFPDWNIAAGYYGITRPPSYPVQVTDTLTIKSYDNPQMKQFTFIVFRNKSVDDGKTVKRTEETYLAFAEYNDKYEPGTVCARMDMVPFDGTNVEYGDAYNNVWEVYAEWTGEVTDEDRVYVRLSESENATDKTAPENGRTPEPEPGKTSSIVGIAAGEYFTLGLRQDGTVVAAGDNAKGQCDVEGWNEIETIAAGLSHSVGLTRDGEVVATGDNELGQCDVEGWEDIVQISAGYGHTVGLKGDGRSSRPDTTATVSAMSRSGAISSRSRRAAGTPSV